jgi:curved DNA-binding protein CbpA
MRYRKKTTPAAGAVQVQEKNPYEILGISQGAAPGEIRKAYLKKLRLSPPEKDPEGFKAIRHAYSMLQDTGQRKALDLTLFKSESGIVLPSVGVTDFTYHFKERIFRFLLASSDFYIDDFSSRFHDISEEIKKLK